MKKGEVEVHISNTIRGIVSFINEIGLNKEDIIYILQDRSGEYFLIYSK